jgi:hypothetical protein
MAGWSHPGIEDFRIFQPNPRLLLPPRRLRLLQRERERDSPRWQQFARLVKGGVRMSEPGFAYALHYRASGEDAIGKRALEWAAGPEGMRDLRQLALVFDWCQPLLDSGGIASLAGRIVRVLEKKPSTSDTMNEMSARVLAAVAVAGHVPDAGERVLEEVLRVWWPARLAQAEKLGEDPVHRFHFYALMELLHVLRDNLRMDLRESARTWFRTLPVYHVLSHYPAPYPAAEGDYRIPARKGIGEPDLRVAALSRAAGFAMVAYDPNALETQFQQGWLMHDRFAMFSAFGSPYEFLWANPYHPGLAFDKLPLYFYEPPHQGLFALSHWEEAARWLGYFEGEMQVMEGGELRVVKPSPEPIEVGPTVVLSGPAPVRFRFDGEVGRRVFVLNVEPNRAYDVEIDSQELREETSGPAGVLGLEIKAPGETGVRIRRSPA